MITYFDQLKVNANKAPELISHVDVNDYDFETKAFNECLKKIERFRFNGQIKSKLTQKKMIQETKSVDQIEIASWCNFCMMINNPNPVCEEKGDRHAIYYETNNVKFDDLKYFKGLCKPFQPVRQGAYDEYYMGILLHYMRTQIDVTDWDPEDLIRVINGRTHLNYNEQLERQYEDRNAVNNYVVNNSKLFRRGISLEEIEDIASYKKEGVAKKLRESCTVQRMTAKKYDEKIACRDHDSVYKKQVQVFTLKPKDQIPDLYTIIEYKEHQEASLDDD